MYIELDDDASGGDLRNNDGTNDWANGGNSHLAKGFNKN